MFVHYNSSGIYFIHLKCESIAILVFVKLCLFKSEVFYLLVFHAEVEIMIVSRVQEASGSR